MKQAGFSLIELLIVVSIIGVLSVVAIPQYQKYKKKAIQAEAKVSLSTLYSLQRMFITNYGWGTANFSQIGFEPKGVYEYTAGWSSSHRDGVPFNVNAETRSAITATPYTGPIRKNARANLFNACKSINRPNRRNSNCFLKLLMRGNNSLQPPSFVPKEHSGLAEDRYVRIDNTGYRNVKFLIGARNRHRNTWIITENKKLVNIE